MTKNADDAGKDAPGFTILGYVENAYKLDGTPPRNSHLVNVEVDGKIHDVRIRKSTNKAHLPQELFDHPLADAIKKASLSYIVARLQERLSPHFKKDTDTAL